ncbi:zinc finger ZAT9-like [Olea europaea subsp. europaea]|uniref:Zinc finger ZAT9-like n=1 Tax=Olea europaea subsp. europaea TaxID=158383 RepID=A0A8S0PWY9_OLEEU|nr:zinc finger ZAT9-like [Olea europaea subsp. europaea]
MGIKMDQESGTNGSMMIKKKSMDPESLLDFTPVEPEAAKYICSTCEKSFPTYQALGRHRSISHKEKKVKVKIYKPVADPSLNGATYANDGPKANAIKQWEVNSVS